MEPFRRKDRKGWWIRYKDDSGRWVTRKGGATERVAYRVLEAAEMRSRAIREGWVDPRQAEIASASRRPIEEVLGEYEAHLRGKRNTSRHVREALRCVRAVVVVGIGARFLAEVSPRPVEAWLGELVQVGRSARTRNVYLARVNGLINWAVKRGMLADNSLQGIEHLAEQVDRREVSRALSPEEFGELIQRTPCARRRAYYLLAGRCGLRWGEIRRLRWEDLDLARGWVELRAEATKARRGDSLPLAVDVVEALEALGPAPGGLVFESSPTLRTFRRDLERAGIAYETNRGQADRKSLRKTFGTHLAMAGVDLRLAAKLMRHSDPRLTLNVYTDPVLLDMREAVRRLGECDRVVCRSVG